MARHVYCGMKYFVLFVIILFPRFLYAQESWLITKEGCKVHNPAPRKGESVTWSGACIDSIANGEGALTWYLHGKKTKTVFIGFMVNGRPEGQGKYTFRKNSSFEGEFKNGEPYKGTLTLKDYKYTYKYSGYFIDSQLQGIGEILVEGSSIYTGEIKNGSRHGKGIEYYNDSSYFEGYFLNDYYDKGIYYHSQDEFSIESENWNDFKAENGTLLYKDDTKYIGDLKFMLPEGEGIMYYTNGHLLECRWRFGMPHGRGEYKSNDGIIYQTIWKKGVPHGKGLIIYPDGKKTRGIWKYGELIEEENGT